MKNLNFQNKKVTVMGLGLHGGAEGLVKFLAENGARILVTDLKPEKELFPTIQKLKKYSNIDFHLGGHSWSDFENAEIVFKNPAVSANSPWVQEINKAGIKLSSEMNLFFELCQSQNIIGVTGTNGKSTTATLIYEILKTEIPNLFFGGNIGGSLLPEVNKIRHNDIVILELSSFQLEDLTRTKKSPHISVILNITPDHLDQHTNFQEYQKAKQNILNFQTNNDIAVLNAADNNILKISKKSKAEKFYFGLDQKLTNLKLFSLIENNQIVLQNRSKIPICSVSGVLIPGKHNLENILGAVLVGKIFKIKPSNIKKAIIYFKGLPHRLEFVKDIKGVKYYNDSKATTPESTIAALNAFNQPIILIAGGKDKKVSLDNLAKNISAKVKTLILMGKTAPKIKLLVESEPSSPKILMAKTLKKAVKIMEKSAQKGDIGLLSPACSSLDQFENFEQRGEIFKKLILEGK